MKYLKYRRTDAELEWGITFSKGTLYRVDEWLRVMQEIDDFE